MKVRKGDRRRSKIYIGNTVSESRERRRIRGRIDAVEHTKVERLGLRFGFRKGR